MLKAVELQAYDTLTVCPSNVTEAVPVSHAVSPGKLGAQAPPVVPCLLIQIFSSDPVTLTWPAAAEGFVGKQGKGPSSYLRRWRSFRFVFAIGDKLA